MEPGQVKRIPAGSKLVLQMHYSKVTGKVEKDRSSIGLIFAKTPPDKHVYTRPVSNNYFSVPPGAERHKVTACWTTKEDIHLITMMPHMHLRGVAQKIEAFYPDGRSEVLLDVPELQLLVADGLLPERAEGDREGDQVCCNRPLRQFV